MQGETLKVKILFSCVLIIMAKCMDSRIQVAAYGFIPPNILLGTIAYKQDVTVRVNPEK